MDGSAASAGALAKTNVLAKTSALLIALACLGATLTACGKAPDSTSDAAVVFNLSADLAIADQSIEKAAWNAEELASRGEAEGWSFVEQDADGAFVWSTGRSTVEVFVAQPKDLSLLLHCQPAAFEGAPSQLSIAVNGQEVAAITLAASGGRSENATGADGHRVDIAAEYWAAGKNLVTLTPNRQFQPSVTLADSQDQRQLAVRWRGIEIVGRQPIPPPQMAGQAMTWTTGTQLTYFLQLPPEAQLRIDSASGDLAATELRISLQDARGVAKEWLLEPRAGASMALPADITEARLDLQLLPRPAKWWRWWQSTEPAAITWQPVIVSPASAAESMSTRSASSVPATSLANIPQPANILIYLIDTLRADHLGTYGYQRPISPHLDRLAADGIVFTDAQAQSSWTRPTVASLFTGLYPHSHGVHGRQDALPQNALTLAEILSEQGFDSAAIVTNGNVGRRFAFDQGFSMFRHLAESRQRREIHHRAERLHGWALAWLDQRPDEPSPFFLYLHASDPHAPYTPPEPFASRFAPGANQQLGEMPSMLEISNHRREVSTSERDQLVDLYDAEIAYLDSQFGYLLQQLEQRDLYDSTLIVVLSDHGEEFLDHGGWEHGKGLYAEQLAIPLIVKLPNSASAGLRIDGRANQVDVLPTVLDWLGVEIPTTIDGSSLLPAIRAPLGDHQGDASLAHLRLGAYDMSSLTTERWKLLVNRAATNRRLFDRRLDRNDMSEVPEPSFASRLLEHNLRRLEATRGVGLSPEAVEIDPELRRTLEALGYL